MLLITKVEQTEVPADVWEISHFPDNELILPEKGPIPAEEETVKIEVVRGEVFKNPETGQTRTIGWTEEVGNILGIPMEAFRNMSTQITDLYSDNWVLQKNIEGLKKQLDQGYVEFEKYRNLRFYHRLGFCFFGRRYLNWIKT
jgi:hypothetical protein